MFVDKCRCLLRELGNMAPEKKLKLSPSSSAKKEEDTLSMAKPDWSLLPPELLNLISEFLGNSFDASIHARSVCNPWRSTFSYPSSVLSRTLWSLPSFDYCRGYCTLLNFPVFLFIHRDRTSLQSEFLIGGIVREDDDEFQSPWSELTSINICDYQIIPLGLQYKIVTYDPETFETEYRAVARLPLTKKGGGEFAVLLGYSNDLKVLTSTDEDGWKWLEHGSSASCSDIVTFRGRFYALVSNELFVIDPYSLEVTPLLPPPLELEDYVIESSYLVPSEDDELYLVQKIIPRGNRGSRPAIRVSRLDEETGEWVMVSDLGDRVLLSGPRGNGTCSGKDLPDGYGLSENSILFTNRWEIETYKYGVDTRHEGDYLDLNFWRSTQQNRGTIVSASRIMSA